MATEATASICSQLSSISIAPVPEENAAAVKEISKKKHEEYQKDIAAGDKKSWKNPKIEIVSPLEVAEEPYFEEPISSWPLPSSDGINKKKQTHRQDEVKYNVGVGDKERDQIEKSGSISRTPHPPLLPAPRQQRERPLGRNPRRGKVQNHNHFGTHFSNVDFSGNQQHQRPRPPSKPQFPFHQQPNHAVNNGFYYPMEHHMPNFPNFSPDWGFNSVPNPPWNPNAPPSASFFINPAPSHETMLLYGYLPGPPYLDGFPYPAHPFSPIVPPPLAWNQQGFLNSLPPPGKASFQEPLESYSQQDMDINVKLQSQIEYYFSDENLMKDGYLKKCMDDQGWISVHTIAMFPRVQVLTSDVNLIMAALQNSPSVEISGSMMRRRGEWSKWILQRGPAAVNDQ